MYLFTCLVCEYWVANLLILPNILGDTSTRFSQNREGISCKFSVIFWFFLAQLFSCCSACIRQPQAPSRKKRCFVEFVFVFNRKTRDYQWTTFCFYEPNPKYEPWEKIPFEYMKIQKSKCRRKLLIYLLNIWRYNIGCFLSQKFWKENGPEFELEVITEVELTETEY